MSATVVQICHDYQGPFHTVARQYAGAFSDCHVTTIFLRGLPSPDIENDIFGDVVFLNLDAASLRGLKMGATARVRDAIGNLSPDLVIGQRYKPLYVAMQLDMDIPLVLGVMHEYGFLGRMTRSLYSRFWKPNVHLVGVSQPVVDDVLNRHQHLAGRVHYVPHGFEAETLVDPVTARHQLVIPLGSYCFGTIGRLVEKKNQELLLRAFARLDGEPVLALVGDGELRQNLEALSRQLKIADRVRFCGHHENARTLVKAFDAFVLSSDQREAFGMVLLEAMSASVPVVTTDAPGPASVVGDAALLFSSGNVDSLARQLEKMRSMNRDDEEAMTRRAIQRLGSNFSLQAMVSRLRGLAPVAEILSAQRD